MRLSEALEKAGVVGSLVRDGDFETLGKIGHRDKSKMLTFCEKEQYLDILVGMRDVSCVIVAPTCELARVGGRGVIVAENPRFSFYRIHHYLARNTEFYGPLTPTRLGKNVRIHPTAIVADAGVCIGDECEVGPYSVIHPRSTIGAGTRIRQHVVIGSSGFEYRPSEAGLHRIDHTGGVSIGLSVDVHSGSVIDCAVYGGSTKISDGAKLDCGVHLSHNSALGRDCIIGARSSIMGNTMVGDRCRFGPHVVTSNGLSIGHDCYVSLGSVVTRDVPPGTRVTGNFAVEHSLFRSLWDRVRAGEFLGPATPEKNLE